MGGCFCKEQIPGYRARSCSVHPIDLTRDERNALKECCRTSPELFTLAGVCVWAKAVDVYDGDTLNLSFHLAGRPVQFRARMLGYDSPEMKPSKEEKHRDEEIARAVRAKNRLIDLVSDLQPGSQQLYGKKDLQEQLASSKKLIIAQFYKFDKYGRPLAKLYTSESACINQIMLDEGHGYEYYGGTKKGSAASSRRSSVASGIHGSGDE